MIQEEGNMLMESNNNLLNIDVNDSKQIFYCTDEKEYTYQDFWDLINATRDYLKNQENIQESKVLIRCKEPLNCLISLFAVISLGKCGVLIEKDKKAYEIQLIMEQVQSNIIITDDPTNDMFLHNNWKAIHFDQSFLKPSTNENFMDEILKDLDLEACIIYTSGSTGKPKGVIRTRRTVFEHARELAKEYKFKASDKVLCVVQLQHAYGLEHVLASMYNRATHYIMKEFSYHDVFSKIRNKGLTIIMGTPYHFQILNRLKGEEKFESLRMFLSGGAPLSVACNEKTRQLWQVPIIQEYGSSELATAAINFDDEKLSAVGKAIAGIEIKIVDEQGKCVAENDIGELLIKSPFCTKGYVSSDDKLPVENGWFNTGDLAYKDSEENVYIVGRKKNIINIAGKKVSPEEVEKVIMTYDGIKEVRVSGVPHPVYGETVKAEIVVEKDKQVEKIDLLRYCKTYLSDYKLPTDICYVAQLERTSSGKIKR